MYKPSFATLSLMDHMHMYVCFVRGFSERELFWNTAGGTEDMCQNRRYQKASDTAFDSFINIALYHPDMGYSPCPPSPK